MDMTKVDEVGIRDGSDCVDKTVKKSPSQNLIKAISYLTPNARQAFIQLRQAFIEAPILQHFDPKYYIRIETDMSSYVISGILSQLTLDNLVW